MPLVKAAKVEARMYILCELCLICCKGNAAPLLPKWDGGMLLQAIVQQTNMVHEPDYRAIRRY